MRWIFLGLIGAACLQNTVAYAQPSTGEEKFFYELFQVGINVRDVLDGEQRSRIAYIRLDGQDDLKTLKALDRLRDVKQLSAIEVEIGDSKDIEECLKRVIELPKLRSLTVWSSRLTVDQLKRIASCKQLEELSLSNLAITDENIRELHALKDLRKLKFLMLGAVKASPKPLEELKAGLTHVEEVFFFQRLSSTLQPLTISPNDDLLMKLRKQKFNAAIAERDSRLRQIEAGRALSGDLVFLGASMRLKDAAIELNDPKLMMNTVNDYVEVMQTAYLESKALFRAASIPPDNYYRAYYFYLDARIEQLRLKKQLESK